ncbi:MAG TPA: toxin-antitoxin system YwqK family antitoxin [Thioploca sp.]|nr:toxin-antitoxin system YwqK family antitoxin [Thioploca sp.]
MQSFLKRVLFAVLLALSVTAQSQQPETIETHYESGALQSVKSYRGSKLHGITKEFYETGEIKAELLYRVGKLFAKKAFRRDGNLEYELKYEDGKKQETQIAYYATGELFRQHTLINGQREGLEYDYYRDGQTKAERNYENGKKEDSARGFHSNGKLQGDWIFENGEPVFATIFYRSGEKWLIHSVFNKKGQLDGVSKEYDKEGDLMAVRYYENNDMVKRVRVNRWWGWLFLFDDKMKKLIMIGLIIGIVIAIVIFMVRLRTR